MKPLIAAAVFLSALPPAAADSVSLGGGKMLDLSPPHQWTLNAHAVQFQFRPDGKAVACLARTDDPGRNQEVLLIKLEHPETPLRPVYVTKAFPASDQKDGPPGRAEEILLGGWASDGRTLLIRQQTRDLPSAALADAPAETAFLALDVSTTPPALYTAPLPDGAAAAPNVLSCAWSPDHRRVLIGPFGDRDALYEPAKNQVETISRPKDAIWLGWLDSAHLLALPQTSEDRAIRRDLASGKEETIPIPRRWPAEEDSRMRPCTEPLDRAAAGPHGLTLESAANTLRDPQSAATAAARAVWVRGKTLTRKYASAAVGVCPGKDDPQARWSPDGTRLAYLSHGDLFTVDLTERDATASEKQALGEKLTAKEEALLATSYLKQIGLAMVQFTQDNEAQFPAEANWQNALLPYLSGNNSLFQFGGAPVIYLPPDDLHLAAMKEPGTTIIATLTLASGTYGLMGDGHVQPIRP